MTIRLFCMAALQSMSLASCRADQIAQELCISSVYLTIHEFWRHAAWTPVAGDVFLRRREVHPFWLYMLRILQSLRFFKHALAV